MWEIQWMKLKKHNQSWKQTQKSIGKIEGKVITKKEHQRKPVKILQLNK